MSRNSSGTYTLPAGNPVVTGTVISSNWANTTLSDIANALTDSLSRTGQGSMQAPLALDDGTEALPGLTWSTEQTSGLYRAGAGDFRYSIGATDIVTITATTFSLVSSLSVAGATGITVVNNGPLIRLNESDAAANNRIWQIDATGEEFAIYAANDALSVFTPVLLVNRTGTTIDTINFANGTLQYGGIEVGYRGLRQERVVSSNTNTVATDAGGIILLVAGISVFTLDTDISTLGVFTIININAGNVTIQGSTSLSWFNGSGSIPTGNRVLSTGGVMSGYHSGGGNFQVWGVGIT